MRDFLTVPDELVEAADSFATYFEAYGYNVTIEKQSLEYPYTPTMVCKRGTTTVIAEVAWGFPIDRIRAWVSYGRSCASDTRVVLCAPADSSMSVDDHTALRDMGAGLYVSASVGVIEVVNSTDLAVNIGLPNLADYPPKVRRALGSAFEQIQRGNWREGFEDACVALEDEARKYLKRHIASGRVVVIRRKNKVYAPTAAQVDRMTLGALRDTFLAIQNPNSSDSKTGAVLKKLNPDRIRVAHQKRSPQAEHALRRNVGRHVWLIVAGLKELLS